MISYIVFIEEMLDKPSNAITTPAKTASQFVAIRDCRKVYRGYSSIDCRKAPSLTIPEGPLIPKGTEFEVEQVIYTADGSWLRISLETMKKILKDTQTNMTTGWVCAEPREMDPYCIPANSQLFVSLWNKGNMCW